VAKKVFASAAAAGASVAARRLAERQLAGPKG
jgi:hypothetical protein